MLQSVFVYDHKPVCERQARSCVIIYVCVVYVCVCVCACERAWLEGEWDNLPSSIIAVVTPIPVTPSAQAASTFKSSFGMPPAWPVLF